MALGLKLSHSNLTRQEQLAVWCRRENLTQPKIASALGVSVMSVSSWFRAETIPSNRHKDLVEFGIPEELLPRAVDKRKRHISKQQPTQSATA